MKTYEIASRTVTMPVHVRDASQWAAQWLVPARAAQELIAHTGLEVAEPFPGRAIAVVTFVRYRDSDLDAYDEVGIGFVVREHGARAASATQRALEVARRRFGVYIHHLPVNAAFTLEAGRTIWGYPKFLADIAIEPDDDGAATCSLAHEGREILTLSVRNDGRIPLPPQAPPTYTFADGVLRRTTWDIARTRIAGNPDRAHLRLGSHPIADELRSLGLPRRAILSQSVADFRVRFHAPEVVSG